MNLFFLLFAGFATGITGAMLPGPLTLFTISETLKSDKFAGLKIIAGHISLEFIFMGIILLGLQQFIHSGNNILFTISIIGGVGLVTMGVLLIFNVQKMKINPLKTNSGFNKGLFLGGMFLSIISPGFILWWSTIGISTVTKALAFGTTGLTFIIIGHWFADTAWYWSLSFAVEKGRMYLSDKLYQNILKILSIMLILLGLHFIIVR